MALPELMAVPGTVELYRVLSKAGGEQLVEQAQHGNWRLPCSRPAQFFTLLEDAVVYAFFEHMQAGPVPCYRPSPARSGSSTQVAPLSDECAGVGFVF